MESKWKETDQVYLNTFGAEMVEMEAWTLFPNLVENFIYLCNCTLKT